MAPFAESCIEEAAFASLDSLGVQGAAFLNILRPAEGISVEWAGLA
jgi:hypothetical protein